MKEKLVNALGGFGVVLFYVFSITCSFAPLLILDFPYWVDFLIILAIFIFRHFGGVLCLGLYIWALIVTLTHPINTVSIFFLVFAVLYFFSSTLPAILLFLGKKDDH